MIQYGLRIGVVAAAASLSACGLWWFHDDIRDGDLGGTVTVNWTREDLFIYRPDDPLWFRPHFMNEHERIQPTAMYTDGGSIPRFFWNIPGLSAWGFGPAFVIHDYIFKVHRCGWPDPIVARITFEESATVLAEVGKALIARKLIKHDALNAIVWGVRTQYARDLWDKPGTEEAREYCERPSPGLTKGEAPVIRFRIPSVGR